MAFNESQTEKNMSDYFYVSHSANLLYVLTYK